MASLPVMHIRYAFRTLFKTPFVTSVAIVSLALGIGANAAIFSLFNQLLLRPLPVAEPAALVNLSAPGPMPGSHSCNQSGPCDATFSYAMFTDLEKAQSVFVGLAAHRLFDANLAARGRTINGDGLEVSGSYFGVLGLQPTLGRLIGPSDTVSPGGAPVAVLSYGFWESQFGRDPGAIGQGLVINGVAFTIIGVGPQGFRGTTLGSNPRGFIPVTMRPAMGSSGEKLDDRRSYWAYLFARLKPGVSAEQAAAALNVPFKAILNDVEAPLQKGMSEQTMTKFKAKVILLEPGTHGQSSLRGEARTPLTILLSVTALVLLIACANIANLLLARAAARAGEIGIRLSLGASRAQLVSQLLVESCVLAVMGGLAGLLVARWTLDGILAILPSDTTTLVDASLDGSVLLFAAGITLVTGLLFGLFPALHTTRPDLVTTLKSQAGQPSGAKAAARFRWLLATGQIALSMALLVAAGLFTRSLVNVSRVDLGLQLDHVVGFGVSPEQNGYKLEQTRQLYERIEDALTAVPGVTGVSSAVIPLIAGDNWGSSMVAEGFDAGPDTDTSSQVNLVGPGFFDTVGMRLLGGRAFTRADAEGSLPVAVVNEAFIKKFNLGGQPIGRHVGMRGQQKGTNIEIVGVVKNAAYSRVKAPPPPVVFLPHRQSQDGVGGMMFYVRTSLPPEQLLPQLPQVVARLDANLPVVNLKTLPQQVRDNVFMDRFISVLSAAFALLATLLAAIGLYGVLAYTVAQRTRELGLRMALGATPGAVRSLILRQVAVMTAVGGVVGLAAAVGLGRAAESLLYELKGFDPIVFGAAAVSLGFVALGAGIIPAWRASRVDPMVALRYE